MPSDPSAEAGHPELEPRPAAKPSYTEAAKTVFALFAKLGSRFRGLELFEPASVRVAASDGALLLHLAWDPWKVARVGENGATEHGVFLFQLPGEAAWRVLPDKQSMGAVSMLLRHAGELEAACVVQRDRVRDLMLDAAPYAEELVQGKPPR